MKVSHFEETERLQEKKLLFYDIQIFGDVPVYTKVTYRDSTSHLFGEQDDEPQFCQHAFGKTNHIPNRFAMSEHN